MTFYTQIANLVNVSANGNSNGVEVGPLPLLGSFVVVTSALPAGSWTPVIQVALDGTNWAALDSTEINAFSSITGLGVARKSLINPAVMGYVRVNYTIVTGPVTAQVYAALASPEGR